MAKKAQATKKSAEQAVSISRLKLNQLFFESLLIIQGFLGIFVIISLFTYSSQDPGWHSQTFSNPLVGEEFGVSNAVGSWGAYLSDFLFTIVGYMAYLVPYWLLWPLVRHFIFFRRPIQFSQIYSGLIGIRILGWSLFLISTSTLLSIFIEPGRSFLPEDTGGLVGSAVSSYTVEPLSFIGSSLLFTCLGLLGLTLSLEISWTTLIIKAQEYLIDFGGEFGEKSADFLAKIREKQRLRQDKIDRQQRVLEEVKKKEKIKAPEVMEAKEKIETSNRVQQEKQEELFEYKETVNPPKLSLLDKKTEELSDETSEHSLRQLGNLVISKLSEYGINDVTVESIQPGPVVIRLELKLPTGLKVSQISNIHKDLARSLAKTSVRIVEVIEGRDTIGVEVPREDRQPVLLSEVLSSTEYDDSKSPLTVALGKDISGSAVVAELSSMPHLLVAGTTG